MSPRESDYRAFPARGGRGSATLRGVAEHTDDDGRRHHSREWWAQLCELSERFDAAYVVEGLGDLIERKVAAPLLRQEVKIAVDVVTRYLNRKSSAELAERADAARIRLANTLQRIEDRSDGGISTVEAGVISLALQGDYPGAAAAAEPIVGAASLEQLFVTALRLERFDIPMALRLLEGGQQPFEAIRSGRLLGRYSWWPSWLLGVVTERALAGKLDEAAIEALDKCAYASLSPAQANLARKLINGDAGLIATAAQRLAQIGEAGAGERLREGDLNTVALAARLIGLQ
jgi:hypothetical protein